MVEGCLHGVEVVQHHADTAVSYWFGWKDNNVGAVMSSRFEKRYLCMIALPRRDLLVEVDNVKIGRMPEST